MAHVVIEQAAAIIEVEHGAGMRTRLSIYQQSARHAELHVDETAIELDQNLLAMAANAADYAIGQTRRIVARNTFGQKHRRDDAASGHGGFQGSDNRFGFREFRQAGPSLDVDQNVAAFDPNSIKSLPKRRIVVMLAGGTVKFPGMPRADHHLAVQRALTERPATMRAASVHGMELAGHVADDNQPLFFAAQFHIQHGAGLQVVERRQPCESHNK